MTQAQQGFDGVERLYGADSYKAIRKAHICVVGIGGVGTWVAEALARSGVGQITLIDMDDVAASNINRQLVALLSTVDQVKIEVMADRIKDINPSCQVNLIEEFVGENNLEACLNRDYDYVIDACDSIKAKAMMVSWCKHRRVPIITIGGAGGQRDPSKVKIVDLAMTKVDPLAAKLRSVLRSQYGFSKNLKSRFRIECVCSSEQLHYPQPDGSVDWAKSANVAGAKMDCSRGFGAVSFVTGTFAFIAVARVLDKIVAKHQRLENEK
ncbi:MAG: tRNA cyclic N6-threonylcarbamoyladenosine(37) synthase TcdA [Gammaproteobacteria bacterium]|jgi:tRNA A37 threonylcarbamoyladenosine dehydratase|nr:MAG: tRNA threonylcarbamoyladenosine dehydratase [Oceanospirillaceae bacterium UBA2001]|tara:strand:+ start:866 stop:1666 length:801 start_codon:yes stop_codon:yes gene_type:complete